MVSFVLSSLFSYIYAQPLNYLIDFSVTVVILWSLAMALVKDNASVTLCNGIGAAAATFGILYATVLNRSPWNCDEVFLMPLSSLMPERYSAELCRQMVMNIFLFLPLGMLLPFTLSDRVRRKVTVSVAVGMLLSLLVETLQYSFGLGWCETDDVLMNTLGTALGGCSYLFFCALTELPTIFRRSNTHTMFEKNTS